MGVLCVIHNMPNPFSIPARIAWSLIFSTACFSHAQPTYHMHKNTLTLGQTYYNPPISTSSAMCWFRGRMSIQKKVYVVMQFNTWLNNDVNNMVTHWSHVSLMTTSTYKRRTLPKFAYGTMVTEASYRSGHTCSKILLSAHSALKALRTYPGWLEGPPKICVGNEERYVPRMRGSINRMPQSREFDYVMCNMTNIIATLKQAVHS